VSELSPFLIEHVVLPLNELGVPIDIHGVQAGLLGLPVLLVVLAFLHTGWKKRQGMKDAGM